MLKETKKKKQEKERDYSPLACIRSSSIRESDPFNHTVHHWQLPVFEPTHRHVSQLNRVVAIPNEQDVASPVRRLHGLRRHDNERRRRLGDSAQTSPARKGRRDGKQNDTQRMRAGEPPLFERGPRRHRINELGGQSFIHDEMFLLKFFWEEEIEDGVA